ncbi:BQ5605_C006g04157 [Microbotryum silenes-dioicae]|uniref:BQ5605_C006g04157 protein n=1 Tax=Microbotryum silenes-dioicae TaxID=796604 RepID=A0A2X0P1Z5_9BASI|nr:BQ5605_C006g04157 [Microbotryum silenes-dioicae]
MVQPSSTVDHWYQVAFVSTHPAAMSISPSSRVLVVPPNAESLQLIGRHLGAWLDKRQSLLPTW